MARAEVYTALACTVRLINDLVDHAQVGCKCVIFVLTCFLSMFVIILMQLSVTFIKVVVLSGRKLITGLYSVHGLPVVTPFMGHGIFPVIAIELFLVL